MATGVNGAGVALAFAIYVLLQFGLGVVFVIFALVAGAAGEHSPGGGRSQGLQVEALFGGGAATTVLLAVAGSSALLGALLASRFLRRNPLEGTFGALGLRPVSLRWLLAGVGAVAAGWVFNVLVVTIYLHLTGDSANPQDMLRQAASGGTVRFGIVLLLGGLLVPFAEELLFRGVLYGWLRRFGIPAAVVASALVFGLFHGFSYLFFTAAFLGVLAALLYERSGSLWPAVVLHATNNSIVFVLLYLQT